MDGFQVKKGPQEFIIPDGTLEQLLSTEEQDAYGKVPAELPAGEPRAVILYILPSAFEELDREIHWRTSTRMNRMEQGGILLGRVFRDGQGQVCGAVEHIIPSTKSGTATYIQFRHDDWIAMYREFDEKYASANEGGVRLSVIGWYHTHPNMPVHMSSIDKNTHISFFPKAWQFSVIFNPQKGIWSVFNGDTCANCSGLLFCPLVVEEETEPSLPEQDAVLQAEPDVPPSESLPSRSPSAWDQPVEQGNGSPFVIRRRSDGFSASRAASAGGNQPAAQNFSENRGASGQRLVFVDQYKGVTVRYRDERFYCPLNAAELKDSTSYAISEELVQQLGGADHLFLPENETVALIYYLNSGYLPAINDDKSRPGNPIQYYIFRETDFLIAAGLVYHAGDDQFVMYSNSCTGGAKSLAVVFSRNCPSWETFRKRYGDCCCALWVDRDNKNRIAFYAFEHSNEGERFHVVASASEAGTDKRGRSISQDLIQRIGSGQIFNQKIYLNLNFYNGQNPCLRGNIKPYIVAELLRRVTMGLSMPQNHYYCIMFRYEMPPPKISKKGDEVFDCNPILGHFTEAVLLTRAHNNCQWALRAQIRNGRENGQNEFAQFVLILSNQHINEDIYRGLVSRRLPGSKYVVSINIESPNSWYFYQL